MDRATVTRRVWELSEPVASAAGLELIDVQYRPEGGRLILRVLIDRPQGGVTLDELARVSREIGDVLDAHDAVTGRYHLECSSPGINRPLVRPEHFRRAVGERVHVRTHEPIAGRRQFHGVLESADGRRRHRPRSRRRSRVARPGLDRAGEHPVRLPPAGASAACPRVRQETSMQPDLNRVIEQVSKEKGIDRQIIVEALEGRDAVRGQAHLRRRQADRSAVQPRDRRGGALRDPDRRRRGPDAENEVTLAEARRSIDPEAEVGDELLAKLPPEKFGRIAAQAAKQNIIQRVRDAERDIIYNEFKDRKGELAIRHRAALREEEHHRQPRPHRRDPAREGADPARALPPGRPHPRLHPRRRAHEQGPADRPVAHASRPARSSSSSRRCRRSTRASSR